MSEITHIVDYESRLFDLLPGQFKTGTNWITLFSVLTGTGSALQDNEDVLYSLWEQRSSLSSAVGWQLDQWGNLLGLSRAGWSDSGYRARIQVWLQVLRSKGTPEELINILQDLSGGTVKYWELYPASYSMQFSGGIYVSDPDLALDSARYLAEADPAGVGIGQIISLSDTPFLFGTAGANGFSQAGGSTYGKFNTDVSVEAGV